MLGNYEFAFGKKLIVFTGQRLGYFDLKLELKLYIA